MGFSFFRKIYNNDEKQKNNKKLQPSYYSHRYRVRSQRRLQ